MRCDAVDDALERLAPAHTFTPDWRDVVERVGEAPPTSRRTTSARLRKRWLLRVALAVAFLSPLGALAAATEDWWFFEPQAPAPITPPPLVVKTGAWDGKDWALVAYRTEEDDLCFSMNGTSSPTSSGFGAALNCGGLNEPVEGSDGQRGINYLSGGSPELPAYVVGPVVAGAAQVVIQLAGGELRTPTFDAPASLGAIRFYVARVPDTLDPAGSVVEKVVGLDGQGRTVACLAVHAGSSCG